jgi:outer membrane beta-barrel protein
MTITFRSLSHPLLIAVVALAAPTTVQAQTYDRTSPLADAPAVRRQVVLRDSRFELGVGTELSLAHDFYHAVMVNSRLGYHVNDWLAISGTLAHNLTPTKATSHLKDLLSILQDEEKPGDRSPSRGDALKGMNRFAQVIGLQAEAVPLAGKLALFSRVFFNYDFYAFAGPGMALMKAETACPVATAMPPSSCAVTGAKFGANFGLGMHAYINDMVALNFELRDLFFRNNAAGRDVNGNNVVSTADLRWHQHYFLAINVAFFLPWKADVSP